MADESIPKTLVVPLDGSDFAQRAVAIAAELAGSFDAELVLMTTPLTDDEELRDVPPRWLGEAATASGFPHVRTVLGRDDHAGVAIADLVAGLPDAAVCMSTHGHGRVASAALGSVATDVVRRVSAPVVLVGPDSVDEPNANGWMVVSHDGSEAADAILAPARTWARALGLLVTVVHVLHPLDVEGAQAPTTGVEHVVSYFGEGTTVRVLRSSYPAGAILDLVESVRPLLVAMATHGRTGLARITLGSVATDVVRSCRCPVLVTRPAALGNPDDA